MTAMREQRLSDPLTVQDAQLIIGALQELRTEINKTQKMLGEISGRMATIQRDQKDIRATINTFSSELGVSRMSRLELEIVEGEKELQILEQRIGMLNEKLKVKQSELSGAIDTNERICKAAESTYAEQMRSERDKRWDWWRETFRLAGRAVIIATIVTGSGGILAALGWFVWFYLTNR